NESACATFIGCWRSDFFASASVGSSANAAAASRPATNLRLALARRERGMDIVEQLQVIVVEVGTHADPVHSTGALRHLRRRGGDHAVFLRPHSDIRADQIR